jgi:hypothetical protein
MQAEHIAHFFWPNSVTRRPSLPLWWRDDFCFAMFSGALANKIRIVFAVSLATAIGCSPCLGCEGTQR